MFTDINLIYLSLAIIFGFCMAWGIGANDVSNAMGTSVGSKAITIKQAIIIAAIFEFSGALIAGGKVTNTIGHNIVSPQFFIDNTDYFIFGMLSALLAAATWLFIATIQGWPVSTTHTIVGAIIGFGLVTVGYSGIQWYTIIPIIMSWVVSPVLGGVISFLLFYMVRVQIFNQKHL